MQLRNGKFSQRYMRKLREKHPDLLLPGGPLRIMNYARAGGRAMAFGRLCSLRRQSNIDKHLRAHGIGRDDIGGFAFRFREVVIDRRAVKDGSLDELVFELGNSDPFVVDLRDICYRVQQMLHVDGLSFLEAEHECRSRIDRVFGGVL